MNYPKCLLVIAICNCGLSLQAEDASPQPKMLERIMRFYSWNDPKAPKSSYQEKSFDTGRASFNKRLQTDEYSGIKTFESKPFTTRVFDGAKKSWFGSLLFHEKKLPENLQGLARDTDKNFASKDLQQKTYSGADRTSPLGGKEDFSTRQITPKGTTQGAIDADQQLQEKVKKGLSIDEVRKLLNKAP